MICRSQGQIATGPTTSTEAARRIEVIIRTQFSVPPDYDVELGGKTESVIPGYDNLRVTLSSPWLKSSDDAVQD